MTKIFKTTDINETEKTPLVVEMLEIIQHQQETIDLLKDEIARLKGQKPKPKIKPSTLEKERQPRPEAQKRPGSDKRLKTVALPIHEQKVVAPDFIPTGSVYKGYHDYVVQELHIKPHNIRYRLQRWQTLQGEYLTGKLPDRIAGSHFGPQLRSFILYQHYHGRVTQPLILEQLRELGVDISAGQFNVFLHALCWIHAERAINKLQGFNDNQRQELAEKRSQIWDFYADLKAYKQAPREAKKLELEKRFDDIFTAKTCFATLNKALAQIHRNKSELLLVLERPDIPLHNNLSERDLREYVTRRKISGSTRSAAGRRCRDTFASLIKTCRKLSVSFWEYLKDRVSEQNDIPQLSAIIRSQAQPAS